MAKQPTTTRPNFWWRLIRNVPVLLAMVKDIFFGGYRGLNWKSAALVLFLVIYLINPFDLISDLALGPGQIDDAVVLMTCLYLLEKDLARYRLWKQQKGDSRHAPD